MGRIALDKTKCMLCGKCIEICPLGLLEPDVEGYPAFIPDGELNCTACGTCIASCPHVALSFGPDARGIPSADCPRPAVSPESALQLLKCRRSIREFTDKPVPKELVTKIIDTTCWAPTAAHEQGIRWLIVMNPVEVKRLAGLIVEWLRVEVQQSSYYSVFIEAWDQGKDVILRGAPHLAITYAAKSWPSSPGDSAIAINYFELAAHAYGLGTCWAGILTKAAVGYPELADALEIPSGYKVYGALMFGYPKYRYPRSPQLTTAQVEWR
jgi:nitroreductase/NAD-dependent dihydropyrimidine dehydrogenase PreA subunit